MSDTVRFSEAGLDSARSRTALLRGVLQTVFSCLAWGVVWLQWFLYQKQVADLFPALFLLLAACVAGLLAARLRLRGLVTALALPLFLLALHWLVYGSAILLQGLGPDMGRDAMPAVLDKTLFLFGPLFWLSGLSFWGAARSQAWRHSGQLALQWVLALALWVPQAAYQISLYSHPLQLGGAALLLALLQLAGLLLAGRRHQVEARDTSQGGAQPRQSAANRDSLKRKGWRGAFALLILLPLLLLFPLLFGQYSEGSVAKGGGLVQPGMFSFDFSSYLKLQSEIKLSKDLVLLYRREGQSWNLLLRRFVLEGYKDGGFFLDRSHPFDRVPESVGDRPARFPEGGETLREPLEQELYIVNFDPNALIAVNYPVEVVPFKNWDQSSFSRVYRVRSMASAAFSFELSDVQSSGLSAAEEAYYTLGGDHPRIRELALTVTAGLTSYADKVQAIHDFLKHEYLYSLKPGIATDGDQLGHFLFESKKGYCSYFAFAMALMCRSLGIPSRVAVGFFIDPQRGVMNFFPVRADMAHAWVEVPYKDFGWMEFDPTSETLAPGENLQMDNSFDMDTVTALLQEILRNRHGLVPQEGTQTEDEQDENSAVWRRLGEFAARNWLWLLAAALVLGWLFWLTLPVLRGLLERRPRPKARLLLAAALRNAGRFGYSQRARESRSEWAARVDAAVGLELLPLVQAMETAHFAESYGQTDLDAALEQLAVHKAALLRRHPAPLQRLLLRANPLRWERKELRDA